jgi:hypothetical protein
MEVISFFWIITKHIDPSAFLGLSLSFQWYVHENSKGAHCTIRSYLEPVLLKMGIEDSIKILYAKAELLLGYLLW